ncbi:hypothetical protein MMC15_006948 [Xylographa vitiligo]|nr:hypothetical protein [Xylographa vitiligo]
MAYDLAERRSGAAFARDTMPGSGSFRKLEPSVLKDLTRIRLILCFQDSTPEIESLESLLDFMMGSCTLRQCNLECLVEGYKDGNAEVLRESFHRLSGFKSCAVEIAGSRTIRKLARYLAYEATKSHTTTTPISNFPLRKLPKELRYQVFSYTDLVANPASYPWADGLVIGNTKDSMPCICLMQRPGCVPCNSKNWTSVYLNSSSHMATSTKCACFLFPSALLRVSQQVSIEVREVFFSRNRFILNGDPAQKLAFLQRHPPEMLRCIRNLDLAFSTTDIVNRTYDTNHLVRKGYEQLVDFIARELDLSNLNLSIDASAMYTDYRESGLTSLEFENYVALCRAFSRPLLRLNGLARFHVFLACALELETEIEKEVMGERFASATSGKVPYKLRDHRYPHRWPLPGEKRRGMRRIKPTDSDDEYSDSQVTDESELAERDSREAEERADREADEAISANYYAELEDQELTNDIEANGP